jgi:peptidoglycan/xylan/chitin deacetylase (PgdA/CDA1 family)
MDFLYKPPKFLKMLFPDIIWDNSEGGILLTIDDGPSADTFRILDSLGRHGLKAVFFCTGRNIEKYFKEFSAIIREGHTVQNHGYHHKRMILRDRNYNFSEVERTNKLINDITGTSPVLFRPPYGLFNTHTLKALKKNGMKMMLWTFLTGDHTGDFASVRRLGDTHLSSNSIIVMHDNNKSASVFDQSLEYIVTLAKDRKFDFSLKKR